MKPQLIYMIISKLLENFSMLLLALDLTFLLQCLNFHNSIPIHQNYTLPLLSEFYDISKVHQTLVSFIIISHNILQALSVGFFPMNLASLMQTGLEILIPE